MGKVIGGLGVSNNSAHLDRIQKKTPRMIRSLAMVNYKEKSKGCKKQRGETEVDTLTLC